MYNYTSYICSPRLSCRSSSPSQTPNQHYLIKTLSLTLIKSSLSRLCIQNLSYAFKQIQFQILQQNKNIKIVKITENSNHNHQLTSQKKGKAFYKQKSMQILRKIQNSLQKKKTVKSEQPRPVSKSFVVQRNKIIEQIAQKLEVKNQKPSIKVDKQQRPHLNRRIARLQTFMQQIKRQRQLNDKPTIILQKKKIDRINYHMLQQKLAEERKKIDGLNKHRQIFGSLQQIREQLKNMQKVQEMFANPENIQEQSIQYHKKDDLKSIQSEQKIVNETTVVVEKQKSQTQYKVVVNNSVQPQNFQFSSRPKIRFINSATNSSRRITFLRPQGQ